MSRIGECFNALKADGRKALVCFITAGDGGTETTLAAMHSMVEAGADIIELGLPFSDPMADGPVIQLSSERALGRQTRVDDVFSVVRQFRDSNSETPVILMGYTNPIEARGAAKFAGDAAEAGVDGIITVDLPPEEAGDVLTAFRAEGIDPVFLVAPTTTAERAQAICNESGGFVYFVAVKGVTGTRQATAADVGVHVETLRKATNLPVGVGFGIRDAESAKAMAGVCDAVIVGSALVECFARSEDSPHEIPAELARLVRELRAGIDAAA